MTLVEAVELMIVKIGFMRQITGAVMANLLLIARLAVKAVAVLDPPKMDQIAEMKEHSIINLVVLEVTVVIEMVMVLQVIPSAAAVAAADGIRNPVVQVVQVV